MPSSFTSSAALAPSTSPNGFSGTTFSGKLKLNRVAVLVESTRPSVTATPPAVTVIGSEPVVEVTVVGVAAAIDLTVGLPV